MRRANGGADETLPRRNHTASHCCLQSATTLSSMSGGEVPLEAASLFLLLMLQLALPATVVSLSPPRIWAAALVAASREQGGRRSSNAPGGMPWAS